VCENLLLLSLLTLFGSGDVGTTAFPLLRVPVSPRACAMGEAFTGLADDVNSIYWNPAGLGQVNSLQLGLAHQEWFGGIRDENVGLAFPVGPGTAGIGAVFSSTEGIEIWDPVNASATTATARSGYLAAGYGMAFGARLNCGLAVKGLYDDLIEQTGTGVCADAGVLYRVSSRLRAGLAAKNLGWGMTYGSDNIPLPIDFRLGLSYDHPRFRLVFDANAPIDNLPDLHLGGEYLFHDMLSLRAGYRLGPQDWQTLSLLSGVTTGLGVNLGLFSLDYAFVPYGELGMTHRIALRTSFVTRLYGKLRIKVTELAAGAAVKAEFRLEGTQQGSSYTESDGTFVVEGVEPGWLKVTATAVGYDPETDSVLIEPRVTHALRLVVRRAGFGSVWGAVNDAGTRRTLQARIAWSGPDTGSVNTDSIQGSFLIRKLRAGDYLLTALPIDSGYASRTDSLTIAPGQLITHTFLLSVIRSSQSAIPISSDTIPPAPVESLPAAQPDTLPSPMNDQ
jgi:hypothetical protein